MPVTIPVTDDAARRIRVDEKSPALGGASDATMDCNFRFVAALRANHRDLGRNAAGQYSDRRNSGSCQRIQEWRGRTNP